MTTTSAFSSMFADATVFSVYLPLPLVALGLNRQHQRLGIYRSWNTVVRLLRGHATAYATVDGVIVARSAS